MAGGLLLAFASMIAPLFGLVVVFSNYSVVVNNYNHAQTGIGKSRSLVPFLGPLLISAGAFAHNEMMPISAGIIAVAWIIDPGTWSVVLGLLAWLRERPR